LTPPSLTGNPGGLGTRLFVVLPAVPNTNRGLIENLFLLRKPHEVRQRHLRFLIFVASTGPADSAEEVCNRGNDNLLLLKGELREDRQRQNLRGGALTLRKGFSWISQAPQRRLLMESQGVVDL
jgi:hypothetical protein